MRVAGGSAAEGRRPSDTPPARLFSRARVLKNISEIEQNLSTRYRCFYTLSDPYITITFSSYRSPYREYICQPLRMWHVQKKKKNLFFFFLA